jgi:hypothetical protein
VQVFSWFSVILSMFIPKSLLIFFNFEFLYIFWGQIRKSYCRVEKASQKFSSGKLKQPSWSGLGGGCLLFRNIFWRRIRRTRLPSKFYIRISEFFLDFFANFKPENLIFNI